MNKSLKNAIACKKKCLIPNNFVFYSIAAGSAIFFLWQLIYFSCKSPVWNIVQILQYSGITLSAKVSFALALYWLGHAFIYLVLTFLIYFITKLLSKLLKLSEPHTCQLGIAILFLSVLAILTANQLYFPLSVFSLLTQQIFSANAAKFILLTILVLLGVLSLLAVIKLILLMKNSRALRIIFYFVLGIVLAVFVFVKIQPFFSAKPKPLSKPNIIIIGLDAIRPDYIHHKNMPALYDFLQHSTDFTNSFTPLARTFPAWVSILTGLYPKHNGARFTFLTNTNFPFRRMLSTILQKQGYFTIYSTDESDFDNIGKDFGFDEIIRPKNGAAAYIIAVSNDFPLSNLILNTTVGKWLFPYNYASRSSYVTYKPQTFINLINSSLIKINKRPIFLSIHFCLPHWPYLWANAPIKQASDKILYEAVLQRADAQFAKFLSLLKKHGVLDNAFVVVLSDHGESLGLHNDRLLHRHKYVHGSFLHQHLFHKLKTASHAPLDIAVKHGTDVLSPSQNRNLLAMRFYDKEKIVGKRISAPVSLIDIKPTIMQFLNLPSTNNDGTSLLPYVKSNKEDGIITKDRPIFIETGLNPSAINGKTISIQDVVYQTANLLQVDKKTSHIRIRPETVKTLLNKKQRALYYGDWVLALYPQKHHELIAVLVNQKTGQWTDDLNGYFAKHSPAKKMLKKMMGFYGDEISAKQSFRIKN